MDEQRSFQAIKVASHKGRSSYCVPPRSLPMCDMTRIQNPSTLRLTRRGKNGGRKWVGGRTGGRVGWGDFQGCLCWRRHISICAMEYNV